MTEPAPEVLLTMPARPEGVGVVRQALAGMADALDFDPLQDGSKPARFGCQLTNGFGSEAADEVGRGEGGLGGGTQNDGCAIVAREFVERRDAGAQNRKRDRLGLIEDDH